MTIVSNIKNRLLRSDPKGLALLLAFRAQAAAHGIRVRRSAGTISFVCGRRQVILGARDIMSVPFVVHEWDRLFATLDGESRGQRTVLDFSQPGLHRYRRHGLAFYCPSLAEDDSMDAYTDFYHPQPGDIVWDVGANAGMTAYFFAQMVGPVGRVYAFEPDDTNYEFLLRNIEMHQLSNVTPVKAALPSQTGTASFDMDGTMGAGLTHLLSYSVAGYSKVVETLSLQDACTQFGSVPNYIKMDIEGAELSAITSSLDFLRRHPIHLAIESNHLVNGQFTSGPLEQLLIGAGYRAWSSDKFGQLFTWAEPPPE
jgi:FkbM family methyltransferase